MNFTKTILNGIKVWVKSQINGIKNWADGIFVSHNPQTLTDIQKEQVRTNIGETNETAMKLAAEMGIIDPVTDENGAVLTDENGNVLTI